MRLFPIGRASNNPTSVPQIGIEGNDNLQSKEDLWFSQIERFHNSPVIGSFSQGNISSVYFYPNGRDLLIGRAVCNSSQYEVVKIDLYTGQEEEISKHENEIIGFAFTKDHAGLVVLERESGLYKDEGYAILSFEHIYLPTKEKRGIGKIKFNTELSSSPNSLKLVFTSPHGETVRYLSPLSSESRFYFFYSKNAMFEKGNVNFFTAQHGNLQELIFPFIVTEGYEREDNGTRIERLINCTVTYPINNIFLPSVQYTDQFQRGNPDVVERVLIGSEIIRNNFSYLRINGRRRRLVTIAGETISKVHLYAEKEGLEISIASSMFFPSLPINEAHFSFTDEENYDMWKEDLLKSLHLLSVLIARSPIDHFNWVNGAFNSLASSVKDLPLSSEKYKELGSILDSFKQAKDKWIKQYRNLPRTAVGPFIDTTCLPKTIGEGSISTDTLPRSLE